MGTATRRREDGGSPHASTLVGRSAGTLLATAMLLRMLAARFRRLVLGIGGVAMCGVRMMRRGFMLAVFVIFRGFAMMLGSIVMLVGGVLVILGRGMLVTHRFLLG
jgi:hypothetical protein